MKAKRPPTRARIPAGAATAAELAPGMYVATPVAVLEGPAVMTAEAVLEADAGIIAEPDADIMDPDIIDEDIMDPDIIDEDIMEEEAAAALEVMSAGIGRTAGGALPQSPPGAIGQVTFWQMDS